MKMFHISDLHFGNHRTDIIECFLKDLAFYNPEVIIISGDITQRARDTQFQEFLVFLNQLTGKVLIVPGNHDVPLDNFITRMFSPFKKYQKYISPQLNIEFQNTEVRILGVNSVNPYSIKDGKMSAKNLSAIQEYFSDDFSGLNVLFFHHNFDYLEGLHKPLENYQQFLDFVKASSIHLICTGHSHYANVSLLTKNNQKTSAILHAGSLSCQRSKDGLNSYFMIETAASHCKIHWRVYDNNSFSTRMIEDVSFI